MWFAKDLQSDAIWFAMRWISGYRAFACDSRCDSHCELHRYAIRIAFRVLRIASHRKSSCESHHSVNWIAWWICSRIALRILSRITIGSFRWFSVIPATGCELLQYHCEICQCLVQFSSPKLIGLLLNCYILISISYSYNLKNKQSLLFYIYTV